MKQYRFFHTKKVRGFTLLELLVVISIIGILTAIGASAFGVAQRQGRDARRKGDMKAVQSAIEQCYVVNNSNYTTCLPTEATTDSTISVGAGNTAVTVTDPAKLNYVITPTQANNVTTEYVICADLDGTSGNASTNTGAAKRGDPAVAYNDFFCVKNLQ